MIDQIGGYLGWIGALILAISGIPQVIHTWKRKSAKDLSWIFLGAWLIGCIFVLTYIIIGNISNNIYQIPLYFNYGLNIIIAVYLLYAKKFYK